ncbi:MAG: hypothetical protein N2C14_23500 [Planctomycetales bacterium]
MANEFDPYHVWLSIPPEEQPPDHYRLLGLSQFETDPDVIESAADRQTVHVRSFQMGARGSDSQRVLNEIAAAKLCLLNEADKQQYDDGLKTRLHLQPKRAVAQVVDFQQDAPIADRPSEFHSAGGANKPVVQERSRASASFLNVLAKSNLLTPEQFRAVEQHADRKPHKLAQKLVAKEWLTRWQARLGAHSGYSAASLLAICAPARVSSQ